MTSTSRPAPDHRGNLPGDADWAGHIAGYLPEADVRRLACAAFEGVDAVRALRAATTAPVLRNACRELLAKLEGGADTSYLAGALDGAATAAERAHARQSVGVVWTGPESEITASRLTAAAVVDLIAEAQRDLLLVSYAIHRDRRITDALRAAAARGVSITLVAETHGDNRSYRSETVPFAGIDMLRLHWPRTQRPRDAALHAKIIVVDDRIALVGSANLTGSAMEVNLECGILIRGGPQPRAIRDHITDLYTSGCLRRL